MESNNELYIRADMNEEIATGHIMRCLSVADAASAMDVRTTFILADDTAKQVINERGYDTIIINSVWNDFESEIPLMRRLISEKEIKHLLVDSYLATDKYLESLSEKTQVAYFDDLNDKSFPCDILIAYDACWDETEYCAKHGASRVLWGYDYIPLRKEFAKQAKRIIPPKAQNLLILSGGADIKHAVKNILNQKWVSDFKSVTAICGSLSVDYQELSEKYKNSESIIVKSGVNNISEYMKEADMCISACGNTVYELMSCGTPSIVYAVNETQIMSAETLEKKEAVVFAGCIDSPLFWGNLDKYVGSHINDSSKRFDLSLTGSELVDGKGAERIVRAMFE